MLFGSLPASSGNQSHHNGNEANLWGQHAQTSSASANTTQEGMNLLDTLFADISGNVRLLPLLSRRDTE